MDENDGDSVGYMMLRWEGSWRSGTVLAVIMKRTDMDSAIDVEVELALSNISDVSGQDSM